MSVSQSPLREFLDGRAYYAARIGEFLAHHDDTIIAALANSSLFAIEPTQRDAWHGQIDIMRQALAGWNAAGLVAFEFAVPRMGKRIDVLVVAGGVVFVLEFKVGETAFNADAVNQVWDYALDMKNFHSASHAATIVPILIATRAADVGLQAVIESDRDGVVRPLRASSATLASVMRTVADWCSGPALDASEWARGSYKPTPTIIEAAMALYGGHKVEDISRREAEAINLTQTSGTVEQVIREARARRHKAICFVTGVPGAGKTLVGLDIATKHIDKASELYSVFLSGNGPLVAILCEALARDKVARAKQAGKPAKIGAARSEVKAFIQNVHHFRDECIRDGAKPPVEHVALFDEAQRAWNLNQTASFMRRKKGHANFAMSEPAFLISCMDRHDDWAVIVCLVGGGQEINTGEAGIGEWLRALRADFPEWHVHLSPHLRDSEYEAGTALNLLEGHAHVRTHESLHLAVSMRSFRAEHVSGWVKAVLDVDREAARSAWESIKDRYPIVLTRDVATAKGWLRSRARGSERYGMVVSSQAQRLKPEAIDVRVDIDPVHWFLHPREDVRSSYYLEDAATEFHVQGLELDWACVVWDGDFRYSSTGWEHWGFRGDGWQRIRKVERQAYLKNAYRVLLTRARQGMVVVVPKGDPNDPTRDPAMYDATYDYLRDLGVVVLD
ncbi:MAG TPA: DUF2075 domain-containing protein [Phycisphaerales bacterium]|nr:DUF2075 domain-containing protein [Phycisphaerales bacterium]